MKLLSLKYILMAFGLLLGTKVYTDKSNKEKKATENYDKLKKIRSIENEITKFTSDDLDKHLGKFMRD